MAAKKQSAQTGSVQKSEEAIRRRAYEIYERRGREHGHDLDDWFKAERELNRKLQIHVA